VNFRRGLRMTAIRAVDQGTFVPKLQYITIRPIFATGMKKTVGRSSHTSGYCGAEGPNRADAKIVERRPVSAAIAESFHEAHLVDSDPPAAMHCRSGIAPLSQQRPHAIITETQSAISDVIAQLPKFTRQRGYCPSVLFDPSPSTSSLDETRSPIAADGVPSLQLGVDVENLTLKAKDRQNRRTVGLLAREFR